MIGALALLPSFAGVTDREEVGRIIRLRAEALAPLKKQDEMSPDAEARQELAYQDECRVIDEIAETPARTLAGLGFKAEVSRVEEHLNPELISFIMTDIAALAGLYPTHRIPSGLTAAR